MSTDAAQSAVMVPAERGRGGEWRMEDFSGQVGGLVLVMGGEYWGIILLDGLYGRYRYLGMFIYLLLELMLGD